MSTAMRQQSAKARDKQTDTLCALLDHLGRLLAEEYVAILTSPHPPSGDPEEAQ
jgi:hypothetical protein